jgi:SAM-dependent methyltransferase
VSAEEWSAVAEEWGSAWAPAAASARLAIAESAGIGAGTRVLDVGCGGGEFVAELRARGADAHGTDPAEGMLARARRLSPDSEFRTGSFAAIPWPDASFDVVTAVNALAFADDEDEGIRALARASRPGGLVAVANWAEAARNDIDAIDAAIARSAGEEPHGDSPERLPGGLEAALRTAGLAPIASGVADAPLGAADSDALVRTILLGEDEEGLAAGAATVLAAAAPFRRADGSYLLRNAMRWAVARV